MKKWLEGIAGIAVGAGGGIIGLKKPTAKNSKYSIRINSFN